MEFTVYFVVFMFYFFLNETATTAIYTYCHTLSLHDALPISRADPTLLHRSAVRPDGSEPTYGRGLSRYVPAAVAVRERSTRQAAGQARSEEHTSELQSLMRISYAVFCLKKKIFTPPTTHTHTQHHTNPLTNIHTHKRS